MHSASFGPWPGVPEPGQPGPLQPRGAERAGAGPGGLSQTVAESPSLLFARLVAGHGCAKASCTHKLE